MASGADPTPESSPQEGISLDELAQAFAQVMGSAPRPQGGPAAAAEEAAAAGDSKGPDAEAGQASPPVAGEASAPGDLSCPVTPRSILEAMFFVGDRENRSLSAAQAAELMRGVEPSEIPVLVRELNGRYAAAGCPYQIVHDGEGYRMSLRKPFYALRDRFLGRVREARLSQAAIDVLAIVAYKQPLSADDVTTMRGKPSNHILAQLVHRGLLRSEKEPGKRHSAKYFTTNRFLRLFGLQTLADLPQSEDLQRQ